MILLLCKITDAYGSDWQDVSTFTCSFLSLIILLASESTDNENIDYCVWIPHSNIILGTTPFHSQKRHWNINYYGLNLGAPSIYQSYPTALDLAKTESQNIDHCAF